ncbi:hypothetical protein ACJJTC_012299 [Scirpophaga incertulas]
MDALAERLRLPAAVRPYFYLFEILEYNFERRLQGNECPHALYIANYSTASSSCLALRRWLFSPQRELRLARQEPLAAQYFFWQAVEDVNRGVCVAGNRLYQLKALQDVARAHEYLALARTLPGYGDVVFPAARSDCRDLPLLVVAVGWSGMKLSAWSAEAGAAAGEPVPVPWRAVREWRADDAAAAVRLRLAHAALPPRLTLHSPHVSTHAHDAAAAVRLRLAHAALPPRLTLHSPHYQYLCTCMDRIAEEAAWLDTGE